MSEITMQVVVDGLQNLATQMSSIAQGLNAVMEKQKEDNHDDVLLDMLRREKQVHDIVTLCGNVEEALLAVPTDELVDYKNIEFIIDLDCRVHINGNNWLNKKAIADIVRNEVVKVFDKQNIAAQEEALPEQEVFVGKSLDAVLDAPTAEQPSFKGVMVEDDEEQEFFVGKIMETDPISEQYKMEDTSSPQQSEGIPMKLFPYDPDAEFDAQNNL
jgi:hypothetical protein